MDVLHSCDTPACVNPAHLRIGTHSENMRDRHTRGRIDQRGEKGSKAKLKSADVLKAVVLRDAGMKHREIAALFGVSQSAIDLIMSGRNWSHLTGIRRASCSVH